MKPKHIFVSLLALAGAYAIFAAIRQAQLLNKSSLRLIGAEPNQISLRNANITLLFEIRNETNFDLTIFNQVYNIYLDQKFITSIRKGRVKIPARTVSIIEADVEFNPIQVLGVGLTSLFTGIKNLVIDITGKLNIATSTIFISRMSIDETTTLGELLAKRK